MKKWLPIIIFAASFIYYSLLSAKGFTWLFASGDSGDWLAASTWWIVPQPYGSPLYIALGHFLNLFPGDLVIKMTILLSALPAAVTVTLVYLIVRHLTNKEHLALISSAILMGTAIFLSQATVLEQYSLAVMFVALAFYFYLKGNRLLVAVSLGLGTANHIMVAMLAFLWLLLEWRSWREWIKVLPVYIIFGILPYGLILYLMTINTPPLLAGYGLSPSAINSYLGSTSVMGGLSLASISDRLADFLAVILMSLGLALIPIWLSFKTKWQPHTKLLVIGIVVPVWYYLTCVDPTSWTFLSYACPFLAISAGIGLSQIKKDNFLLKLVATSAVILIIVNTFALNANMLSKAEPRAEEFYAAVWQLPDGVPVVMNRGGFEALAVFYAMSQGKEIIPIFYNPDDKTETLYQQYVVWLESTYDVEGENTLEQVEYLLDNGVATYKQIDRWEELKVDNPRSLLFDTLAIGNPEFELVTGVTAVDVAKD